MRLPGLQYDSPYAFTPKQRWRLRLMPPVLAHALLGLYRTARVEVRGEEHYRALLADPGHAILAFWHESMALAGCHFRGTNYHTLTSYSFDGEMAARVIRYYGEEAVRGSSSRGGAEGLRQLEKALALVPCVGITMDGPRGPRRRAKTGAAVLSARTGTPILPVAFALSARWRLRSWDRFPVPKPGCRIVCAFAPPIAPPANEPEQVEAVRREAESRLNALHERLEAEMNDPQEIAPAPE